MRESPGKIIINMLLLYLLQRTKSLVINCIVCCVADPNSVELNIDGTTDKCSKGEDINFIFTGFTLSGKVGFKANKKHVPCFYRIIETLVKVWENDKCCGNMIHRQLFPLLF